MIIRRTQETHSFTAFIQRSATGGSDADIWHKGSLLASETEQIYFILFLQAINQSQCQHEDKSPAGTWKHKHTVSFSIFFY